MTRKGEKDLSHRKRKPTTDLPILCPPLNAKSRAKVAGLGSILIFYTHPRHVGRVERAGGWSGWIVCVPVDYAACYCCRNQIQITLISSPSLLCSYRLLGKARCERCQAALSSYSASGTPISGDGGSGAGEGGGVLRAAGERGCHRERCEGYHDHLFHNQLSVRVGVCANTGVFCCVPPP